MGRNPATKRLRIVLCGSVIGVLLVVGGALWPGPAMWRQFCLSRIQSASAESRWPDAMSWLVRMRWIDPHSTESLLAEARILRKQGDVLRAREILRNVSSHEREAAQFEELLIQAQSGNLASSEEHLLKALQSEFDISEVLDALVQGYLRTGQYSKADVTLSSWRDLLPHDIRSRALRGLYFMQLADWTNAIGEFREVLRRQPRNSDCELFLAESLLGDKQADEAVERFRRSLTKWPDREPISVGLARALILNGQSTQAAEVLTPLQERRPHSIEVRKTLGEALLNCHRPEEAIRVLQPAIERSDRNPELRHLFGTALRVVGRVEEAERHLNFAQQGFLELQEAQRLREHLLQNLKDQSKKVQLASLLLQYEQDAEAMIWLRSVLAEEPRHGEAMRLLAEVNRRHLGRETIATAPIEIIRRADGIGHGSERTEPGTASAAADWRMTEVTSDVGVNFAFRNGRESGHGTVVETIGGGVAWLDADMDGRLDLLMTGGGFFAKDRSLQGHSPVLFRQVTADHFEPVTHLACLDSAPFYSHGVAVADHDHDGFPDLLVTGYAGVLFFHNQGDGTFRECARERGLVDDRWSTSAGWGDLNGDGHLDVYVAHYLRWNWQVHHTCPGPSPSQPEVCSPKTFEDEQHFIFLNQGDGSFREVSTAWGLRPNGKGLGVVLGDIDLDGDLDLYVGNDTTENFLYVNNGRGHLDEVGRLSGVDVDDHGVMNGSMGVELGDTDNDGLPDIWVTNYLWESFGLYQNLGQRQFQHRSQALGISAIGGLNVGWGTGFADLDRDGDEDLIATTGHVLFYSPPERQVPVVLRNESGRRFSRVTFPTDSYLGQPHHGRGLAIADYDQDGDLDFAVSHNNEPASLVRNDIRSTGSWLRVQPIGRTSNRDAIGAWIILHTTSGRQLRMIKGGGSYLSHSDRCPFWGIPAGAQPQRLEIHWPSGLQQELTISRLNQNLIVIEP